jgi:hypothetical protein
VPDPRMRAGDDDREAVAASLGTHMAAGRLSLAEYEDRLARAYAARTFGELAELTADLPGLPAASAPAPARQPVPAPVSAGPVGTRPHGHMDHSWRAWLSTSVIVLVIYLATSIGDGDPDYFWPIWVIGPWGAVLLANKIRGGGARPGEDRPQLGR